MALRIQARATRRCGELLDEIKPSKGGRPSKTRACMDPSKKQAAKDAGLSEKQRKQAQRVARVNGEDFDRQVESNDPPSVSELAEQGTKKNPATLYDLEGIDPVDFKIATAALGAVRRMREFAEHTDQEQVIRGLKQAECEDFCSDILCARTWLTIMEEGLKCH